MKIALTGAHRVGKTTLAGKLLEYLPDYELIPEPYHALEGSGYLFSETPSLDDYIVQLKHSMEQISKSTNNVIFDRCPVDLLAYIHALDEAENIQSFFNKVHSIMTKIELLVFVPIEEPDLIFCPESESPGLRYKVNEILNDWIRDFDIKTIEVIGTLSARCEQVIKECG